MKRLISLPLLFVLSTPLLGAIKNADAFWAGRPAKDTNTISIISFEGTDNASSSLADDMAALANPVATEIELPPGTVQPRITSTLLGDATEMPAGRFGQGVQLSGKGAVELSPIVWAALSPVEKAFSVEFHIKPDAGASRAVLMTLPKAGPSFALRIVRESNGTVFIATPDGTTITNSMQAPAGTWTHIAIAFCSYPERTLGRFMVNGVKADIWRLWPKVSGMMPKIIFGANLDLSEGFKGVIDEIRISSNARDFYAVEDDSFCDPAARRPIHLELPYFARRGPLNVALSFDNTVTPEILTGSVSSGKVNTASFVPAVRGQACDAWLAAKSGFRVEWTNAIPRETGTLEFWMRPIDWDNLFIGNYEANNIPYMSLLRITGTGDAASLGTSELGFRLGRGILEAEPNIPFTPMQPGAWTHILCTWNNGHSTIYLNGRPQNLTQVLFSGIPRNAPKNQAPDVTAKNRQSGPFALTFQPSPHTLIDELRIYPWAFSGMEAANAYNRWLPESQRKLSALPPIRFEPWCDYNYRQFYLRTLCMPANEQEPATAHVVLKSAGKTESLFEADIKLDAGLSGQTNTTLSLPFGDYIIEGTAKAADGSILGTTNWPYSRKAPVWWQNELGKTKGVPAPWTPIKVEADKLSVWNRDITLAPGGLPGQIFAAGTNMLTAPSQMRGELNGQPIEFHGDPIVFINKADDLTEWTSRLKAKGITADVKGSIEYDGMMSFTVTLSAESTTPTLDRLTLDIPFAPDVGSQLIVNGGGSYFRAAWDVRFVPQGTGSVWNSQTSKPSMQKGVVRGSFCPVIWLGDDFRGVCFFGENDKGWTPGTNAPAQEIRRENNAVAYRMNIITRPVTLDKPRTFTFIVHPTPTKPLPAGWRAYNRGGVNGKWAGLEGIDACISPTLTAPSNATTHLGMTFVMEPPSWDDAIANGEILRERAGKNNPRLFYMNYSWPRLGPSMDEFKPGLWNCGRMLWTREVEDYMTWIINEYIKRDIFDGLYIDDTSLGANSCPFGTSYLLEDGTMQPGFNSLGFRRFLKRVRVLFQQAGKQPMIIPHMTYCFEIPALSFADACVNGEDRDIYYPTEQRFSQVWNPDELRIQSSSPKWGFITYWKNGVVVKNDVKENENTQLWRYWQSRDSHSLAIQSDLWYTWADNNRDTIEPSLAKIGLDAPDLRFIPNWRRAGIMDVKEVRILPTASELDTATPVAGSTNSVLVCAYARKNRALMMVSNRSTKDQSVTITIHPSALFNSTQGVRFADADLAMTPPGKPRASADDIKNAQKSMEIDLSTENGQADTTSVDELLAGQKRDKNAERLTITSKDNTVTVPVRHNDFRLVEVRINE
jgi:hypothetical protein